MNLKQFLEDNNIRFWESGKNVSKNHINIRCRFCGDSSNHFGINIYNLKCNCWKCGSHSFVDLIQILLNCKKKHAISIAKSIRKKNYYKTKPQYKWDRKLKFPKEATKKFPCLHLNYLKSRGLNPEKIIKQYNLYSCYLEGNYKYRIIIPIIENYKTVSFTSRDVSDESDIKYKTASPEESLIDPSQLLFNIDNASNSQDIAIMEGPFDVFRFGDGGVSLLGVKLTDGRLRRFKDLFIRKLYICLDNDKTGIEAARKIKYRLQPFPNIEKCIIVKLQQHNDIGEMTFDEVQQLKYQLKFNQ